MGERQVTLVALWGPKPPLLIEALRKWQAQLESISAICFRPYDLDQIHATIVGLECLAPSLVQKSWFERTGARDEMDLAGLLRRFHKEGPFPLRITIGGHAPGGRPFTSRGLSPWERSFSLQSDKAVVIGWPSIHGQLSALRRGLETFHVDHVYGRNVPDDDFYLRLGFVDPRASQDDRKEAEAALREELSQNPLDLELTPQSLSFVSYDDATLPRATSRAVAIGDPTLDLVRLKTLYREPSSAPCEPSDS